METQTLTFENMIECHDLHTLINHIADDLALATSSKKSIIINDVPEDIFLQTDEELVSSAMHDLLSLVISHSQNSRIRITAKFFGNVVLLHVKDDGCLSYDSISQKLNKIQSIAEQLGGFIGFTSYRNKLTTIAFSFMNAAEAA